MSDTDLKNCDLLEFSRLFSSEYKMPEFSDRVLVFDVMPDNWDVSNLVNVLDGIQSNKTSGGKRSLETVDNGPQQKRIKNVESKNEILSESLVADPGSKTAAECEQAVSVSVMRSESERENAKSPSSKEPSSDQGIITSSSHVFTSNSPQIKTVISNDPLRQPKICVHSVWLSVQSPYFRSLFHSSGMKETQDTEVHIKITQSQEKAHLILIEAMYRSDVLNDKTVDVLLAILELADKYDVKFVFKKCKYVLQKIATTFELSTQIMHVIKVKHDMDDVEDLAATLQSVLAEEFSPLDEKWEDKKFVDLSEPSLKYLLSSDDLIVQSENTVFHALMYWMEENEVDPAGMQETNDLLAVVRFKLVTIDYLYNVINNHPIASKMPSFTELYLSGMTYHAIPAEQKKRLEKQPGFRKKSTRAIIQYAYNVRKNDFESGTGLNSDHFWACGYKMSLKVSGSTWSSWLPLCIHNLKKESLVPLRFSIRKKGARSRSMQERTFSLDSCESRDDHADNINSYNDFENEAETCTLFVVVEPLT
ncbi:kelch-like protein 4 [Dendronephthya gigantea]|uniref:kelch-like protein 4 n=1 Tax=Dendronephthya gigantea TaxID=151771 RepID=UPI00106B019B|nr:kelch-like protein 4 [Dendronephthya gigantea]